MIQSKTLQQPGQGPDVQSILLNINDALIRSPVPEDFFPDFDRIASGLLQYDRMAISFYVNRRFQVEYAYASGTTIENFEQGSLQEVSEEAAGSWFGRKKAFHLSGDNSQNDRLSNEYDAAARSVGLRSLIVAPIRWHGESIGYLMLRSRGKEAYSDRDLALIDMLANKISGVVANAQAVSQARLESSQRESLLKLSRLVSSVRSLHKIQEQFGKIACSLIDADRVSITVPDTPGRSISIVLVYGRDVDGYGFGSRTLMDDFGTIPWLETTAPYIVDDDLCNRSRATAAAERVAADAGLASTLIAPIVWQGESIAAIAFRARAERAFNRSHVDSASAIANQVAGAIANQIAYQEMRRESRTRELLAKLSRAITSSQKLDNTFDDLGQLITSLVPSDRISITLLAEPGDPPTSVYQYGVRLEGATPGTVSPVRGDLHSLLLRNPVPMVVDNEDPRGFR